MLRVATWISFLELYNMYITFYSYVRGSVSEESTDWFCHYVLAEGVRSCSRRRGRDENGEPDWNRPPRSVTFRERVSGLGPTTYGRDGEHAAVGGQRGVSAGAGGARPARRGRRRVRPEQGQDVRRQRVPEWRRRRPVPEGPAARGAGHGGRRPTAAVEEQVPRAQRQPDGGVQAPDVLHVLPDPGARDRHREDGAVRVPGRVLHAARFGRVLLREDRMRLRHGEPKMHKSVNNYKKHTDNFIEIKKSKSTIDLFNFSIFKCVLRSRTHSNGRHNRTTVSVQHGKSVNFVVRKKKKIFF